MALCVMWCEESDLCCDKTEHTQQQIDDAILGASQLLDRISYHQYGACEFTVMPCHEGCSAPCYNKKCHGQALDLDIPKFPISEVTEINVFDEDGNPVTNSYVDEVWFEGNTVYFPANFVFPEQSSGIVGGASTWNIVVEAGIPVPIVGKRAAIELAKELLKDPCDDSCGLPPQIDTVSRDGTTYDFVEIRDAFATLPWVSQFIEKYGQTRRWSGAVSPQNHISQLVQ